jgi:hypothetical protein
VIHLGLGPKWVSPATNLSQIIQGIRIFKRYLSKEWLWGLSYGDEKTGFKLAAIFRKAYIPPPQPGKIGQVFVRLLNIINKAVVFQDN